MKGDDLSDEELFEQLKKRGLNPRCKCQRWQTYLGRYDADGWTWRCRGCLRAIAKCMCR